MMNSSKPILVLFGLSALTVSLLLAMYGIQPQPVLATAEGLASYYADSFEGQSTASGDVFSQDKFTAAHKHFPLGSILRVTNPINGRSVEVRVNDRGPYAKKRVLDLTKAAANALRFTDSGVAKVQIEVLAWGTKGNVG